MKFIKEAHENSASKGFWDDCPTYEDKVKAIPLKLALIHSEISEALECFRDKELSTKISDSGKPEGFPSELADAVIRIADLAGALGIDLEHEITIKMAFNSTRPPMHGRTC